jgi:hypothetical protein
LEDGAFSDCFHFCDIYIPSSITKIGKLFDIEDIELDDDEPDKITVFCELGSAAFNFAKSNNINCAEYAANLTNLLDDVNDYQESLKQVILEHEKRVREMEEKRLSEEKRAAEWKAQQEAKNKEQKEKEQLVEDEYQRKKNEFSREESLYAEDLGSELTTVVIPKHIKVIKEGALKNNPNVDKIIFESGSQLVRIERGACACLNIRKIRFPASLREIEDRAFIKCWQLRIIEFECGSRLERIGEDAFLLGGDLSPITLPGGVKYIGKGAFDNYQLKAITLPRGCHVENGAFAKETTVSFADPASLTGTPEDSVTELINAGVQKLKGFWSKLKK